MLNPIQRIRSATSETYRIRHGFGITILRNEREIKALYNFCKEELEDIDHMLLNKERQDIYKATIDLIDIGNSQDLYKLPVKLGKRKYYNLFELVEEHIGWYWN